MKQMSSKILSAALVLGLGTVFLASAQAADFGVLGAGGRTDLTQKQMMTCAIQDEYLARAEYEPILKTYGPVRPFTNIVTAEERHIAWLTGLFTRLMTASENHLRAFRNTLARYQ